MIKPFPWAEAMQFGFGVLHLSSDAFWKMTPRELAHAIIAVRGRAPAPIEQNSAGRWTPFGSGRVATTPSPAAHSHSMVPGGFDVTS